MSKKGSNPLPPTNINKPTPPPSPPPVARNMLGKIGYVVETTYSETPSAKREPITLLPIRSTSVEPVYGKKTLKVQARFDCPCCGKGVQIEINHDL